MGLFIAMLVSGYPPGDCLPENFVQHLTPGAPDFAFMLIAVILAVVFGLVLEKRGYRLGNCRILNIVFVCVALVSFNPWCNMWMAIAPDFFGLGVNPWCYITGIVCLAMAIRGIVIYEKLPPKPEIIEATGKKPLLK